MAPRKSTRKERAKPRPYHHGDLASALLRAAEAVLKREGVEQITLRAVAREAGVSHTAPKHHFGDLAGLLSELAAVGFARFRDTMLEEAKKAPDDTQARGGALGRGYLQFARKNPGLFLLMFRSGRLDMKRPALAEAADSAFAVLAQSQGVSDEPRQLTIPQAARITGAWAFVHGLALLSIDDRLKPIVVALPPGTTEETLLFSVVDGMAARMNALPPSLRDAK